MTRTATHFDPAALINDPAWLMRCAEVELGQRNLQRADILCRMVLDTQPRHARALAMLADIAGRIGMREHGAKFLSAARQLAAGDAELARDLAAIESSLMQVPDAAGPGERFLLVKAWGYGFWADVDHVLGALLLAEMTGRVPVVHWGGNSLYSDDPDGDAFEQFFEPVSRYRLTDLPAQEGQIYPPKWTPGNLREAVCNKLSGPFSRTAGIQLLSRTETLIVSDYHIKLMNLLPWAPAGHALHDASTAAAYRFLVDKYLKPRPAVLEAVHRFRSEHFGQSTFAAVHVRTTDKAGEMPFLDELNQRYFAAIEQVDANQKIFLLTDSTGVVETFRRRFGDRVIATGAERADSQTPVHYKGDAGQGHRRGLEVMIDTYVAAQAEVFIGNGGSNVSAMVEHLKPWPSGQLRLLCPSRHYLRGPMLLPQGDIAAALKTAVEHHQAGRLPEAEALYRQILYANPEQAEALNLLGVVAGQTRRLDLSVELIRRAIAVRPDFADAHHNLGNALRHQGKLDEARICFDRALALKKGDTRS
jgi:protein O-GlcNAc transferase